MNTILLVALTSLLASLACGAIVDENPNESKPCSDHEKVLKNFQALLSESLLSLTNHLQGQGSYYVHDQHAALHTGGAVFTRWGRTVCPPGNDLVRFAAGDNYNHKGGSSNLLCLPEQPIYANFTPGKQAGSKIDGTEYESSHTSPNFKRLHDHDVPCSVCHSQSQRSVIMLPARNQCLSGWRLEYWGYLMGGNNVHASTNNYVCVDVNAEAALGGKENKGGNLLYLTESTCGSLPCPPYEDGQELTCSVCTKK